MARHKKEETLLKRYRLSKSYTGELKKIAEGMVDEHLKPYREAIDNIKKQLDSVKEKISSDVVEGMINELYRNTQARVGVELLYVKDIPEISKAFSQPKHTLIEIAQMFSKEVKDLNGGKLTPYDFARSKDLDPRRVSFAVRRCYPKLGIEREKEVGKLYFGKPRYTYFCKLRSPS